MMPPPRTTDVSFTRTTTLPAIRMLVLGGFLMLAGGRPLAAQSATQMVTFRVLGRSRAAVTPIATPLAVHPTSATVANGTFALSTNEANQKIVASIDQPMPVGSSLSAGLGAPAAGTSAGMRTLDTSATDVLTEIAATTDARLPVAYSVVGAPDSGRALGGEQRTVTYTILAGP